ncbi:MAG TPA: TolC family protein [Thermoanaerobaculia bacterium]|nr:TolC family protein [Thermoanaerobaculia bacterium]
MKRFIWLLLLAQPLFATDFNDPQSLVDAAIASHPTLARLRAEVAAARERVAPAGALPNPMLMAGVQNKQVDLLRDDEMMTMYMAGASQTFVRPAKRDARRAAAELAAHAVERELDSARAEIERDVLLAWYDLAAIDAELHTIEQVRELVDAVIAAARVRYEVGTSAQADVIRAQLQQSNLEHDVLRLRGARRNALARLLPLLDLPFTTEVPPVTIPEGTDDLAIGAPAAPPDDHPAIAALETEVARQEALIRLARLETKPDFDIEASYGMRPQQRDMFSVVARIELPFRRKDLIEPRVREAIALRDAAKLRIAELRRSLTQEMAIAVAAHEEATSQLKLHEEVLVPQARLAFESTLAAYQTGKAAFDAILTTETAYLRLRLQYFDLLARHAQAVVNYEALRRGARIGGRTSRPPMEADGTSAAQMTSMP